MPRHYPTPSTTTYYINEYLIDDMFRVDFARQQKHQPIWGYDSVRYDFLAKGKEVVSGNIIINFRYPGYLRNVLAEHNDNKTNFENLLHRKKIKEVIGPTDTIEGDNLLAAFDSAGDPSDKNQILANAMGQVAERPVVTRSEYEKAFLDVKAALEERFFMNSHSIEEERPTGDGFDSPIDESEIIEFDLSVRYGFQGVPGGFQRIFRDVVLLGEQETVSASVNMAGDMSSSAQPILEIYPFICRTIETKEYI